MRYHAFAVLALLTSSAAFAAQAPKEAPPPPKNPFAAEAAPSKESAAEAAGAVKPSAAFYPKTEESTPLLTIRFNQHRVYFDRALRQAVRSAENTRAGVDYYVISVVPAADANRAQVSALENLNSVVSAIRQQGIPDTRIHSKTDPSGEVASQEVRIYVQ